MKKAIKPVIAAKRVTFQVTANPKSTVSLVGTFNQWDAKQHPMKDRNDTGTYTITLMLPKGEHEYKFVINGNWIVDPECHDRVHNDCGTLNSFLKVE